MAKLSYAGIRIAASTIVKANPNGIRFRELVDQIAKLHPETPRNSISGSIWDLDVQLPAEVSKPSRGLYVPAVGGVSVKSSSVLPSPVKLLESDFYDSFTEYLKNDLQEATEACSLGGAGLKGKWGTPDVLGVYKKLPSDRVAFFGEILAAEVKIDPQEFITAFGQAIAYKLFAARTYIVMPRSMPSVDQERLDALCTIFGVGFILFDLDAKMPNYRVELRAQRSTPDMFYLNRFADELHNL